MICVNCPPKLYCLTVELLPIDLKCKFYITALLLFFCIPYWVGPEGYSKGRLGRNGFLIASGFRRVIDSTESETEETLARRVDSFVAINTYSLIRKSGNENKNCRMDNAHCLITFITYLPHLIKSMENNYKETRKPRGVKSNINEILLEFVKKQLYNLSKSNCFDIFLLHSWPPYSCLFYYSS